MCTCVTSDLHPAHPADQTVVLGRPQQEVDSDEGGWRDGRTDRRPGLERTADRQQLHTHTGQTGAHTSTTKVLLLNSYFGLSSIELMNRYCSEAGGHLLVVSGVRGQAAKLCGQLERLTSGGGASL